MNWRKPVRGSSYGAWPTKGPAEEGGARAGRACVHVVVVVALLLPGVGAASDAQRDRISRFDIPRQRADQALIEFAEQADVTFIFPVDETRKVMANEVKGEFTQQEAIERLLAGTRLTPRFQGSELVVESGPAREGDAMKHRGIWASIVAAFVGGTAVHANAQDAAGASTAPKLEEIIVTAQKREERLQDVPISVAVLSSADLDLLGATQFRDFANAVPGLTYATMGAGFTQISLRGVTAGLDISPTVGIYVDEIPYGSSTSFNGATQLALDAGLFDLDHVEVLRGPQGTLYGASTMGGLIKYVTRQPVPARFFADAEVGLSTTQDGGLSYLASTGFNLPLAAERAALRVSVFDSHDGGYVDNVARDKKDVNRSDVRGGRVDLLLTPSDALTFRLNAFVQDISRDGDSTVEHTLDGDPVYSPLQQFRGVAEPFDQRFRIFSATATYDVGSIKLTSVSGYQTVHSEVEIDISPYFAGTFGAVGTPVVDDTDKFTQEFRIQSNDAGRLEWLLGGFYTHEDSDALQTFDIFDLDGQPVPNNLVILSTPSTYEELSAFADLTWHFNSQFDVTGGLRYAHNRQTIEQISSGLFIESLPETTSRDEVLTYLVNGRYRMTDHVTAYARFATGYRPGGPNYLIINEATGLPYEPLTFESDTLKSYEAGLKAATASGRLGFDLAAYYIDWSNIQVATSCGAFGCTTNARGGAQITGAEVSLTANPTERIVVTGAFAYQDASLKQAEPALGGAEGERLPNVPRFTASVNADYKWTGDWSPTLGATLRYVSDRYSSFESSPTYPSYHLPSYTTLDLRGGITLRSVDVRIYVRNLFDERGQLSALYTNIGDPRVSMLQPRTIGLNLSSRF